jgi:ADP-ribosyl-[dinitrogen reductase] hydrolase
MAMCLAESLVTCGGFDPRDQCERYVKWYLEGHWSVTKTCFGIGNGTRRAGTLSLSDPIIFCTTKFGI